MFNLIRCVRTYWTKLLTELPLRPMNAYITKSEHIRINKNCYCNLKIRLSLEGGYTNHLRLMFSSQGQKALKWLRRLLSILILTFLWTPYDKRLFTDLSDSQQTKTCQDFASTPETADIRNTNTCSHAPLIHNEPSHHMLYHSYHSYINHHVLML